MPELEPAEVSPQDLFATLREQVNTLEDLDANDEDAETLLEQVTSIESTLESIRAELESVPTPTDVSEL